MDTLRGRPHTFTGGYPKSARRFRDRLCIKRCLAPPLLISALAVFLTASLCGTAHCGPPDDGEALVVRLVRPERQAAEVLKLFQGSRAAHPAAALAAWKKAAPESGQLGKPLEAVISIFNPEMASEWRTMHGSELVFDWNKGDGKPRWHAIVPQDDGTVAAAVAAARLSDGGGEAPLLLDGNEIAVARIDRQGATLAACSGNGVVFGSTRDELLRALARLKRPRSAAPGKTGQEQPPGSGLFSSALTPESGATFVVDAKRLANIHSGPLPLKLPCELLRRLSCSKAHGTVALDGGCVGFELITQFPADKRVQSPLWSRSGTVDPSWLAFIPSTGVMAIISLAFEPNPAYWDSAFALADGLEKTYPDRAELRPFELASICSPREQAPASRPISGRT